MVSEVSEGKPDSLKVNIDEGIKLDINPVQFEEDVAEPLPEIKEQQDQGNSR